VKGNFWLGIRFTNDDDLNRQGRAWYDGVANLRVHGTTHERPVDRWPAERAALRALSTPDRLEVFLWDERRVARDGYVSWDGTSYGMPWPWRLALDWHWSPWRFFPTDPPGTWTALGTVHLGIVVALAILPPTVCFVTARKLWQHPACGYAQFTVLTGVLTGILTLMLLFVWSGMWRPGHRWIGLYERAVFVVPSMWMGVMALRLIKKG
jgi:hypothetical protein